MKHARLFMVSMLVISAVAAGCAQTAVVDPSPQPTENPLTETPDVMDYGSLVGLLRDAGHTVDEGETLPDSVFAGETSVIKVNGQEVQVHEYATPEDMEKDAANLDGAGTIYKAADGSVMQIDWIDTPHFFKNGRVMVMYIGRDEVVYGALETLLGKQFIGGDMNGMGGGFLPPDAGPFVDANLAEALGSAGGAVEAGDAIEQGLFSVGGQVYKVNGQDVQVFVFADEAAAIADAATVSPDGGTIGTVAVRWIAPPHFYLGGNLIVLYVGEDAEVKGLLDNIIGQPFAGQ